MNKTTYTEALQRNSQRVYLIALSALHVPEDAEDVMQTVFLRLWQHRGSFQDQSHMDKWLTKVAVNESRSQLRRRRGEVPLEAVEAVCAAPGFSRDQDLVRAVMELPPALGTVIHLFYYEELSVKEIAAALHLTQNAVKVRLSRGREALRRKLKEEHDE